jgi:hypothetical protein
VMGATSASGAVSANGRQVERRPEPLFLALDVGDCRSRLSGLAARRHTGRLSVLSSGYQTLSAQLCFWSQLKASATAKRPLRSMCPSAPS